MLLWLDDYRRPPTSEWTWAKDYNQAVTILNKGEVVFASLDHDLSDEHYQNQTGSNFKEKTGYHVMLWMEENNVWPEQGVRVHTMNPSAKVKMLQLVNQIYGRTFQYAIEGTHRV
jgi:hypothetical protein